VVESLGDRSISRILDTLGSSLTLGYGIVACLSIGKEKRTIAYITFLHSGLGHRKQ
jgi:hypothetical protein